MKKMFKPFIIGAICAFAVMCILGAGSLSSLAVIDFVANTQPAVSNAGQTRLYVDSTRNTLMASSNAGSYYTLEQKRNIAINGDMNVWQRGTAFSNISTTQYTSDRWKAVFATPNAGTYTIADGIANTWLGSLPSDFNVVGGQLMQISCTHVNTPLQAGSYFVIRTTLEGQSLPVSIANSGTGMTLSFYAYSFQTGQFGVTIHDLATSKFVCTTFNIAQSNTWQRVAIPFGNCSINAVHQQTSGGLEIDICLVGGSTCQTTASTTFVNEIGGPLYTTSSQVNFGSSTSNVFALTEVQLEPGQRATTYEYCNYQQELALCQRYCYVVSNSFPGNGAGLACATAVTGSTSSVNALFLYPQMRGAPGFSFSGTASHVSCEVLGTGANNVACTGAPTTNGTPGCTSSLLAFPNTGATWAAANTPQFVFWNTGTTEYLIWSADF